MGKPLKQVILERKVDNGTLIKTCWLDGWKKFKIGSRITLKDDPDTWWTVQNIGETIIDSELLPHSPWGSLRPSESIF